MAINFQLDYRKKIRAELRTWGIRDWKKVWKIINTVPGEVMWEFAQEQAQDLARAVQREIEDQPFWWQPLNPQYLEHKRRQGLDERMLIATKEYIEGIGIQRASRSERGGQILVGVPNRVHADTELNMNELARIHEYGTDKIPARPHWKPAFDKWKSRQGVIFPRLREKLTKRVNRKLDKLVDRALREVKPK